LKVLVYVEGPSDRTALEKLLRSLLDQGKRNGVGICFIPLGNKDKVLHDSPRKAADHLADAPEDWVFAVPDLYPMARYEGTGDAHGSLAGLRKLLLERFTERADRLRLPEAVRPRFRVHCLKHDLEVLLLASPEALRQRLKTQDQLRGVWRQPIEDQNDARPPKRIVEQLFDKYRRKPAYQDTVDAPWILERARLEEVRKACPQCFAPLVTELEALAMGGALSSSSAPG
jgi:hypothetical protein